jgi:heme exporter protein B
VTHLLFKKEITLELRKKSAIAGLLLYLFSTSFIAYLTFRLRTDLVTPLVWSALFWIIVLFSSVNAIAKSFMGEQKGREIYYYSIAGPSAILISKLLYNLLFGAIMGFIGWILFYFLLGNPIFDLSIFAITILLVSFGFAASLTLLSAIASKANNNTVLMSVLSLPVVISILLMATKISRNCIDGLGWSASADELVILLAINCLVAATSYILFPYIWRS